MSGARLRSIRLTVADPDRARRFYRDALGFTAVAGSPDVMRLGAQEIALQVFETRGAPYPPDSTSSDLWFHHFAIVVSDIAAACRRVSGQPGFAPITRGGPQRLPPNTGCVSAYKFRDPDGHPLELLQFAPESTPAPWRDGEGLFLGIDHSAICVADVERSVRFYAERFGLAVFGRSLNRGEEQARLDDLADPVVDVVAMGTTPVTKPHLELLAYRTPRGRPIAPGASAHDIAMTRLAFEVEAGEPQALRDPDGHLVVVEPAVTPSVR